MWAPSGPSCRRCRVSGNTNSSFALMSPPPLLSAPRRRQQTMPSGPMTSWLKTRSAEIHSALFSARRAAGGYATSGVLRKNAGGLREGRAPTRGALSPEPRPPDRVGPAPVLPVPHQRAEGRARHRDDRVVRDPVLLRADAPPRVDDPPVRAPGPRAQAPAG